MNLQPGRWLWLVLPPAIAIGFERLVLVLFSIWQQSWGGIPPGLFFYLPFLSALPPLLLLLIACWWRRDAGLRTPWSDRQSWPRDLLGGGAAALLCIAAFVGCLQLLRQLGVATPDFARLSVAHHVYFSTLGALIPAIAEELYFRGFLAERFRDLRPALRLLLASASFALWHVKTPAYLLHTFAIGLLLGWLVLRTGRLLPAIVAHGLANAAAGLIIVSGGV